MISGLVFGVSLGLILHQVDQFCLVGQLPQLSCVQYRDAALGCIARWRMGGFRPDIGPNELPVGVHPPPTQCLLPPCFVIYCTHPVQCKDTSPQVKKYTNAQIHKFTNTQMHKYKYTLPLSPAALFCDLLHPPVHSSAVQDQAEGNRA